MYTVLRYYIKSKLKTLLSKQKSSNNLGEEGLTNRLKVEININSMSVTSFSYL